VNDAFLASLALGAGVAFLVIAVGTVILRAAGTVDVPLQATTALAGLGLMLLAAGASMQRSRDGHG
jgi:hypothetical protein